MRQKLAAVAVVALVVLAGCSGGGGSSTPTAGESTPTETPAGMDTPTATQSGEMPTNGTAAGTPTPTAGQTPTATPTDTDTPTPTPGDSGTPSGNLEPVSSMSPLPRGVTEQTVTNTTALFEAQSAALMSSGFEYDMRLYNTTQPDASIRIANDTKATYMDFGLEQGLSQEYYVGPTEAGIYNSSTGRIAYGRGPTQVRTTAGFVSAIIGLYPRGFVASLDWETQGVYTTDGGEQRLVLESTSFNETGTAGIFAPSLVGDSETLQRAAGRIEVTSEGVVRYGNVTATVTQNGQTYTKGLEFTIGAFDSGSITKPDWLQNSPEPSLSVESSDRLLVYEYAGDESLSAGSNLTIGSDGFGSLAANLTLSESVSPGETVYISKTGARSDASYNVSVGERPTLPDEATAFSGVVVVTVRVGVYELAVGTQVDA